MRKLLLVLVLLVVSLPPTLDYHIGPVALSEPLQATFAYEKPITPIGLNEIQREAYKQLERVGWGEHWEAYRTLIHNESGWRSTATNPTSGAYGLPQALPCSKMYNCTKDYRLQIKWSLNYIKERYGNPQKALAFWQSQSPHWY